MKKILALFALSACLTFAAKAQTTQSGGQTQTNLQSTNDVSGQASEVKPTDSKSGTGTSTNGGKSCCSSKEMKESGKKGEKSCCSDGKKNDAHCADKNKKTEMHDDHDNRNEKSNNK